MKACSKLAVALFAVAGSKSTPSETLEALAEDGACGLSPNDEACGVELLQHQVGKASKAGQLGEDGSVNACTPGCFTAPVKTYHYEDPHNWALTDPVCSLGSRQSPICIDPLETVPFLTSRFQPSYVSVPPKVELQNSGHNLLVKAPSGSGGFGTLLTNDDQVWEADSYHIHGLGEHLINSKPAAMELHIVHLPQGTRSATHSYDLSLLSQERRHLSRQDLNRTSPDGPLTFGVTVVGILIDIGLTTNPCIQQLLYPVLPKEGCTACITKPVDLGRCFGEQLGGPYWYYSGSFTTPPCTEQVQWYVMAKRATITALDLARFKTLGFQDPANNRPVQPLNGRVVYFKP